MPPIWTTWPVRATTRVDDEENDTLLEPIPRAAELIRVMACVETNSPLTELRATSDVFLKVLDSTLDEIPERLIDVTRTSTLTDTSAAGIRQRLYAILLVIATTLASQTISVSMKQLHRVLADRNLVRSIQEDTSLQQPTLDTSSSETMTALSHQPEAAQLVFLLIGALTLLYTAVPDPEPGMLQMKMNRFGFNPERWDTGAWEHMSQHANSLGEDITLDKLLCRFSRTPEGPIPNPTTPQQRPGRRLQQLQRGGSHSLNAEDVSFDVLDKLLNIQIFWTPSVCEHLEFDVRTKRLKLFRFPSYCVLLCRLEPERTFLDGLFNNFLGLGNEDDDSPNFGSANFFREVFSTYRLIFGQHKDARALMEKYCARGQMFGFQSPFYDPHPSAFVKDSTADPLLHDICLRDSRNLPLFIDLDMLDLKNIYNLDIDFPFFATRLSLLDQFIHSQLPHDWEAWRRQRRNLASFWTMWTNTVLSLPALVVAVIQLVIGGVQLWWAKHPAAAADSALPNVSDETARRCKHMQGAVEAGKSRQA